MSEIWLALCILIIVVIGIVTIFHFSYTDKIENVKIELTQYLHEINEKIENLRKKK